MLAECVTKIFNNCAIHNLTTDWYYVEFLVGWTVCETLPFFSKNSGTFRWSHAYTREDIKLSPPTQLQCFGVGSLGTRLVQYTTSPTNDIAWSHYITMVTTWLPLFVAFKYKCTTPPKLMQAGTDLASFPGPAQLSVACSWWKAGRGLGTRL